MSKTGFLDNLALFCLIIQYYWVPMLFKANFYDKICFILSCNKFFMSNKKKIDLVEGSIYVKNRFFGQFSPILPYNSIPISTNVIYS